MENKALKEGTIVKSSQYTYKIIRKLGQGSFGITYLASTQVKVQTSISGALGKLQQEREEELMVCIKEFFMQDVNTRNEGTLMVEGSQSSIVQNYRKKFRKEAENLSMLDYPGIVKVLEVFDTNNTTYYVMEYIDGQNLDDFIPSEGLSEESSLGTIRKIAESLEYMHSQNMLHMGF